MLTEYPRHVAAGGNKPVWIDLCDPDPPEFAQAEAQTGMGLPSRESLSEIESSSRLRERDGILSVSIPMFTHREGGPPHTSPVGFILSRDCLVTLRYDRLSAFDAVAERFASLQPPPGPLTIFVSLCDEIVDRLADSLEQAAADLRKLSANTFHDRDNHGREAIRSNRQIRAKLRHVGRLADGIAETRDVLLGVGRAVGFVCERTREWDETKLESRLMTIQRDVASLAEYEVHLSDKVQFLLDAMVGLIGIAQNDVFKILTIVSIIGIPPTLIAGIYGMNFKYMPEYSWSFGYSYGLIVIALSGLLPLAWFKWRGWF
jgi:magnesium transporter